MATAAVALGSRRDMESGLSGRGSTVVAGRTDPCYSRCCSEVFKFGALEGAVVIGIGSSVTSVALPCSGDMR